MSLSSQRLAQTSDQRISAYGQQHPQDAHWHLHFESQSEKTHPPQSTAAPLTWQDVIVLWQQAPTFRALCTDALANIPFDAFFWETPPITVDSLHQPWECVAVQTPSLSDITADPQPFAQYFNHERYQVSQFTCVFPNLKGDAQLVVPRPLTDPSAYAHLAQFLRAAPREQHDNLWQQVGIILAQRLNAGLEQPIWVSTSGLGVYWLHVRLDTVPKYYTYSPYQSIDFYKY